MKVSIRIPVAMLLCILTGNSLAEKPRFGDTLTFSLGGMRNSGDATISSTRDDAPIDKISFKELGLADSTEVIWADFSWQFAERWRFGLNYSRFDSSGSETTSADGNFGDLDWIVGARISSQFDMNLYIADLTWDFLKTEKAHLGVGLGLHAADLKLGLGVEVGAGIGGGGGVVEVRSEQASVLAPLPNVSLIGGVMIGEKVYLRGQVGYFSLSYDKYDGELFSVRGAVEWRPWKHVGLGAAYQYVSIDLEVDGSSSREEYDLDFYGPVLFFSVGF